MKRLFALVICAALILSCLTVTAFAAENVKISSALRTKMNETPDNEKIEVWIFSEYGNYSEMAETASNMTRDRLIEEYGVARATEIMRASTAEDISLYNSVYQTLLSELESKKSRSIAEKLALADEDIHYLGYSLIADLSKEQIWTAASFDEVWLLSFDDSEGPFEDLEPEPYVPLDESYFISQIKRFYADSVDIDLFYLEKLTDTLYAVRFTAGDYSTDRPIISKVGNYILRTDDGLPEAMIFSLAGDRLCSFSQAYEEKLLDGEMLQKLSESEGIRFFQLRRGDADMDNTVSVLDATQIQKYKVGLASANSISEQAADADADGVVSVLDATRIQKHLAGMCEIDDEKLLTANAQFEVSAYNVYGFPHAIVTATGGYAPYQYCYKIKGGFHAYSSYGEDFGEYHIDTADQMPGEMNFTTGWVDSNVTTIPLESLTYGDSFELVVTVKDATGTVSEPVTLSFVNIAPEYPITVAA